MIPLLRKLRLILRLGVGAAIASRKTNGNQEQALNDDTLHHGNHEKLEAVKKSLLLKMDPLVARAYHNLSECLLIRLPDELLLLIMEELEIVDILRLRRISRDFMRLFGCKAFAQYHESSSVKDPRNTDRGHYYIWGGPPDIWQAPSQKARKVEELRSEILRELYCATCFDARDRAATEGSTTKLEYLHCSGCGSDHQEHLFSDSERHKSPNVRVCIGRQGRLRLCEHVSVCWDDVIKIEGPGRQSLAKCYHSSHFSKKRTNMEVPELYLNYGSSDERNLVLKRYTIVELPHGEEDRPTIQQFRCRLEEIERVSPCPWYPFANPTTSTMRVVDPNRCRCLEYAGADQFAWQLSSIPTPPAHFESPIRPLWRKREDEKRHCHWASHRVGLQFDDNRGTLHTSLCSRCPNSVHLQQSRGLDAQNAWHPSWYLALDPTSYELPGFYGIGWCLTKTCRNYLWHRLELPSSRKDPAQRPPAEIAVNRKCGKDCDASTKSA